MLDLVASIAAPLVGGVFGSNSASNAADAQVDATNASIAAQERIAADNLAFQREVYEDSIARNQPYYDMGTAALQLQSDRALSAPTFRPGRFEASPEYEYRLNEGLNALDAGASARGIRMSGAALMDRNDHAQGFVSNEYDNWWGRELDKFNAARLSDNDVFNRLGTISGTGQIATNALDTAGQNFASGATSSNLTTGANIGNALQTGGEARASGYAGQNAAWQNALSGVGTGLGAAYAGYFGQNPGFGITPYADPYARA